MRMSALSRRRGVVRGGAVSGVQAGRRKRGRSVIAAAMTGDRRFMNGFTSFPSLDAEDTRSRRVTGGCVVQ